MKNLALFWNILVGIGGVAGTAWYLTRPGSTFFLLLLFFVLLGVVAAVSVVAILSRTDAIHLAGYIGAVASLVILFTMLLLAFAISPGSGAAALPFIGVAAGGNILALDYLGDTRRASRSNRSRRSGAPV